MKLEKAIEIKEAYFRGDEPDDPLDLITADRLSLAALKSISLYRLETPHLPHKTLSGEDKQ